MQLCVCILLRTHVTVSVPHLIHGAKWSSFTLAEIEWICNYLFANSLYAINGGVFKIDIVGPISFIIIKADREIESQEWEVMVRLRHPWVGAAG